MGNWAVEEDSDIRCAGKRRKLHEQKPEHALDLGFRSGKGNRLDGGVQNHWNRAQLGRLEAWIGGIECNQCVLRTDTEPEPDFIPAHRSLRGAGPWLRLLL